MGLGNMIGDAVIGMVSSAEWHAFLLGDAIERKKFQKDCYYCLKKNKEYVEDSVEDIIKELTKERPLMLARLYSVAYVALFRLNNIYVSGEWKFGSENFLDTLTFDKSTQNKLKKLLVSFFWKDNGGVTHNDDPNYFEDVRKHIDLIDQSTMFEVLLSDIERLFKDPESKEAVAISRVRTYLKKKESELKGDTEGNESLTALLKDLM